jgi:hypothetical membrane protein
MDATRDRESTAAGIAGPAVLLATLAVGGLLSPAYEWPTDPFSTIGAAGGHTATLFGAGITLGGLLFLPFAARLWLTLSRVVGGAYAVVGLSFAGAGLVPAIGDAPLHELFGAVAFLGLWILPWIAGVVDWRAQDRRAGATAVALGSVALVAWLPYDLGLTWAQIGYGAAELVSLVAFALWSALAAVRLRRGSTARTTDHGEAMPP